MHRLFASGQYNNFVYPSLAPSMDIQIALTERLLFYFLNGNTERVCEVMQSRTNGRYSSN